MSLQNYKRTRIACFTAYITMASVFVLPPMLFVHFHNIYDISYTLLGTLILVNFLTQMMVDLLFTFFAKHFNIPLLIRSMPLLTSFGLLMFALLPSIFPNHIFICLALSTIIFSVAAGLGEVLLSPLIATIPSDNPERDMSLLHSIYGWGVVISVLLSSLFFSIFGINNWKYLAVIFALFPLFTSIMYFISPIPEMNLSSGKKGKKGNSKGLVLCVLCIFLGSSAEITMTNWISSFMENALNIPKTVGDIVGLALFALLLALTRVLYAKFTPDISKVLLISMIGASVCYLIAGFSTNVILSFVAAVLIGIFTSMLWPGTLILMEEKIPTAGVAAFALMAAAGDTGASVAPQLLGIIVDKVSASNFANNLSQTMNISPGELGMKIGMLVAAIFPIIGIAVVIYIMHYFKNQSKFYSNY